VSFDEYNLDAEVSVSAHLFRYPRSAGDEEILNDPSAITRLAGFLIRGHADDVSSSASRGVAVLKIHMEH
jgi:hypothetical protein